MAYKTQYQRQLIKVTEWRRGMIWKTKVIGTIWLDEDDAMDVNREVEIAKANGADMLGSMPTGTPFDEFQRSVKV